MTGDVLHGVGVGRGAAVGTVALVRSLPDVSADAPVLVQGRPATTAELSGLVTEAFERVSRGLQAAADAAHGTVAEVLSATALMAADPALRAGVRQRVEAGEPPVGTLDAVIGGYATMFQQAGGYLADRVTDLHSVRDLVVATLLGLPAPGVPALSEPSVIVARDLAPADTAALDLDHVVAIVTEQGGPTSHTAIIAGQLGIPCVVRVAGATDLPAGSRVVVDAAAGTVDPAPDDAAVQSVAVRARLLTELATDTGPGATADAHPVTLLANIGTAEDAERAAATAAEGIGLFRTEVLFFGRSVAPDVDEQAETYARVLRVMGDRKVVVRTLDAGADKPLAFAPQPGEENPALGVRGYRMVRTHPELLDTQLAALARAQQATGVTPWVMAPMIATAGEAAQYAQRARGHGLTVVGVMVEVPAAALRAREVLGAVDFVSLGTNDLAQYTMAADRLRGELADLLDPWQPAVLGLVAATGRAGAETGKPVGVCGESAGDPVMALVLVGLGVTSLSMAPAALPAVRYTLRRHTLDRCRQLAEAALGAPSAVAARAAVLDLVDPQVRSVLGV